MPKFVTHALNPNVHAQTMCGLQVYEDRPPYIEMLFNSMGGLAILATRRN